jgi:hypothetical protein
MTGLTFMMCGRDTFPSLLIKAKQAKQAKQVSNFNRLVFRLFRIPLQMFRMLFRTFRATTWPEVPIKPRPFPMFRLFRL